jgi:hypothetical protein
MKYRKMRLGRVGNMGRTMGRECQKSTKSGGLRASLVRNCIDLFYPLLHWFSTPIYKLKY